MSGHRKLRAACDRCHELKNRCTRAGGSESRCDRCERLDIDCVYNQHARMGRPRVSWSGSENRKRVVSESHSSHARNSKRRATQNENQQTLPVRPANAPQVDAINLQSTSQALCEQNQSGCVSSRSNFSDWPGFGFPASFESTSGFLDPSLLHAESAIVSVDRMNWFNPPDFAHTAHNEPTSEDGDRQLHQEYHQVEDLQPQHKDLSGPSDSTVDDFEKRPDSSVIHGGRDELVRLQIRMNDLLNGGSESSPGHSLGLGEVMMVCKELLELLPVTMHRPSSTYGAKDNHHGDGTALPLKSINASPNNEFTGSSHDYGRRFNGKEGQHETQLIDHIALLQIATSYAFALQLIDCAIDDIGTSASNMEFVSLGTFNLASQPAMSTSVGAYMVSNMIQQLRNTISLLAPEYNSKQKPPAHTSAPQQESNSSRAPNEGIKVPMQAAMNMVHEKETSMLEKLANIMISPQ